MTQMSPLSAPQAPGVQLPAIEGGSTEHPAVRTTSVPWGMGPLAMEGRPLLQPRRERPSPIQYPISNIQYPIPNTQ